MPLLELSLNTCRWQVDAAWRDVLFGADGLRLEEWRQSGAAQAVKHGPHRSVYRVDLADGSFFVKHYRLANTRAWLRELVRPSKARMEYDRALAVATRGVPTFTPLALGESWSGGPGESFLITRTLDDTAPLNHFLETSLPTMAPGRQTRVRQRLAVSLAELIAHMHDAGIRHDDLHAGNLLLSLGEDDRPRLYLIDLHAVHVGVPLDWTASRENLVMLNRWFIMRAERTDRLRFWKAYCRERASSGFVGEDMAPMAKNLESRTRDSNRRFWRQRDKRCLANNRYYQRIRHAGMVGHAVTDLDPEVVSHLIANPDEPLRRPKVPLLKDSRSSTVAEFEVNLNGRPIQVIYKRFCVTTWADPWKSLLRPAPALRSWIHGQGLRERCLPTPRPLAVFHRQSVGLPLEGYVLVEKVPGAEELARHVASLDALPEAQRCRLMHLEIDQLARLLREMHDRNVSHRDLKAANILVQPQARGVAKSHLDFGPFWLIDLVGVTLHGKVRRVRRVQNLARLHASFQQTTRLTRTDKLRFLRVYLQSWQFGKAAWKAWWRDIGQATQAKTARNLRNGRPLA